MNAPQISLQLGDFPRLDVDVLVCPASPDLTAPDGLAAELHRLAGPGLQRECRRIGHCPVGESEITSAYGLPSRYVVHAVTPVWRGGGAREARLLAACYHSALEWAIDVGATSIAFPALAVAEGGYPARLAAEVAVRAIRDFPEACGRLSRLLICCGSVGDHEAYRQLLAPDSGPAPLRPAGSGPELPGFPPPGLTARPELRLAH